MSAKSVVFDTLLYILHFQVTDPAFPALFFAGAPEKGDFHEKEKYLYFYNKPGAPEKGDFNKKGKKVYFLQETC